MATPSESSRLIRRLKVVLLSLPLFATSCAGTGPPTHEWAQSQPPTGSLVSPEAAPADGAIAHAASTLSRELAGDAEFASVEVINGNRIIVHWHGPVGAKLRDLLARFPSVDISVQPADCSPGQLSDFASELLASDPVVTELKNAAPAAAQGRGRGLNALRVPARLSTD